MRRIIISVIISAVIVTVGTFFGVRHYTQASSTVTAWDADVNADGQVNILDLSAAASYYQQTVPAGARPVAEQNLDANGNMKVAQQGPIDVNVLDTNFQFTSVVVACGLGDVSGISAATTSAQTQLNILGGSGWKLVGSPNVTLFGSASPPCVVTYTLERPQ